MSEETTHKFFDIAAEVVLDESGKEIKSSTINSNNDSQIKNTVTSFIPQTNTNRSCSSAPQKSRYKHPMLGSFTFREIADKRKKAFMNPNQGKKQVEECGWDINRLSILKNDAESNSTKSYDDENEFKTIDACKYLLAESQSHLTVLEFVEKKDNKYYFKINKNYKIDDKIKHEESYRSSSASCTTTNEDIISIKPQTHVLKLNSTLSNILDKQIENRSTNNVIPTITSTKDLTCINKLNILSEVASEELAVREAEAYFSTAKKFQAAGIQDVGGGGQKDKSDDVNSKISIHNKTIFPVETKDFAIVSKTHYSSYNENNVNQGQPRQSQQIGEVYMCPTKKTTETHDIKTENNSLSKSSNNKNISQATTKPTRKKDYCTNNKRVEEAVVKYKRKIPQACNKRISYKLGNLSRHVYLGTKMQKNRNRIYPKRKISEKDVTISGKYCNQALSSKEVKENNFIGNEISILKEVYLESSKDFTPLKQQNKSPPKHIKISKLRTTKSKGKVSKKECDVVTNSKASSSEEEPISIDLNNHTSKESTSASVALKTPVFLDLKSKKSAINKCVSDNRTEITNNQSEDSFLTPEILTRQTKNIKVCSASIHNTSSSKSGISNKNTIVTPSLESKVEEINKNKVNTQFYAGDISCGDDSSVQNRVLFSLKPCRVSIERLDDSKVPEISKALTPNNTQNNSMCSNKEPNDLLINSSMGVQAKDHSNTTIDKKSSKTLTEVGSDNIGQLLEFNGRKQNFDLKSNTRKNIQLKMLNKSNGEPDDSQISNVSIDKSAKSNQEDNVHPRLVAYNNETPVNNRCEIQSDMTPVDDISSKKSSKVMVIKRNIDGSVERTCRSSEKEFHCGPVIKRRKGNNEACNKQLNNVRAYGIGKYTNVFNIDPLNQTHIDTGYPKCKFTVNHRSKPKPSNKIETDSKENSLNDNLNLDSKTDKNVNGVKSGNLTKQNTSSVKKLPIESQYTYIKSPLRSGKLRSVGNLMILEYSNETADKKVNRKRSISRTNSYTDVSDLNCIQKRITDSKSGTNLNCFTYPEERLIQSSQSLNSAKDISQSVNKKSTKISQIKDSRKANSINDNLNLDTTIDNNLVKDISQSVNKKSTKISQISDSRKAKSLNGNLNLDRTIDKNLNGVKSGNKFKNLKSKNQVNLSKTKAKIGNSKKVNLPNKSLLPIKNTSNVEKLSIENMKSPLQNGKLRSVENLLLIENSNKAAMICGAVKKVNRKRSLSSSNSSYADLMDLNFIQKRMMRSNSRTDLDHFTCPDERLIQSSQSLNPAKDMSQSVNKKSTKISQIKDKKHNIYNFKHVKKVLQKKTPQDIIPKGTFKKVTFLENQNICSSLESPQEEMDRLTSKKSTDQHMKDTLSVKASKISYSKTHKRKLYRTTGNHGKVSSVTLEATTCPKNKTIQKQRNNKNKQSKCIDSKSNCLNQNNTTPTEIGISMPVNDTETTEIVYIHPSFTNANSTIPTVIPEPTKVTVVPLPTCIQVPLAEHSACNNVQPNFSSFQGGNASNSFQLNESCPVPRSSPLFINGLTNPEHMYKKSQEYPQILSNSAYQSQGYPIIYNNFYLNSTGQSSAINGSEINAHSSPNDQAKSSPKETTASPLSSYSDIGLICSTPFSLRPEEFKKGDFNLVTPKETVEKTSETHNQLVNESLASEESFKQTDESEIIDESLIASKRQHRQVNISGDNVENYSLKSKQKEMSIQTAKRRKKMEISSSPKDLLSLKKLLKAMSYLRSIERTTKIIREKENEDIFSPPERQ